MNADEGKREECRAVDAALREWRAAALAATQIPESFWTAQRKRILDRAGRHASSWRPALPWAVAAAVVTIIIGVWLEEPRSIPAPDIAAGYDQDLLMDVERLTNVEVPLALDPAMLIADEIAAGRAGQKAP